MTIEIPDREPWLEPLNLKLVANEFARLSEVYAKAYVLKDMSACYMENNSVVVSHKNIFCNVNIEDKMVPVQLIKIIRESETVSFLVSHEGKLAICNIEETDISWLKLAQNAYEWYGSN